MSKAAQLRVFIRLVVGAGFAAAIVVAVLFPPTVTGPWLLAFGTLLALAVVSALLALKITEGGSTTAMDFVPQLGAVLLLGPVGAVALTAIEELFTEFLVLKKRTDKALFNTAQVMLATATASLLYLAFGGQPSLQALEFRESFPPFVLAVIGYFAVNTLCAPYAISLSQDSRFIDVWRHAVGNIIVLDLVMSSLAYLVAFLYVQWGSIALLAAIIPIIGLRYS